ncbi:hypothetical protein [uncultured Algibacter sp.]|uniref:hypothetical protein n=1 Tax=uncultured Algibacter sp. TaxID=298659 RepID=UPI003216F91B
MKKTPVLVDINKELPVLQKTTEVTEIKATTKDGFAVAEIGLQEIGSKKFKVWDSKLSSSNGTKNHSELFIKVESVERAFFLKKRNFLKINVERPLWMYTAWHEYYKWLDGNLTEKKGDGLKKGNEYIKSANGGFTADKNAWCGCFAHWVLSTTNSKYGKNYSKVTINPSSSQN